MINKSLDGTHDEEVWGAVRREWARESNRCPLGTTTIIILVLNIDCGKKKVLELTTEEFPADFVSLNDFQVDRPPLNTW